MTGWIGGCDGSIFCGFIFIVLLGLTATSDCIRTAHRVISAASTIRFDLTVQFSDPERLEHSLDPPEQRHQIAFI